MIYFISVFENTLLVYTADHATYPVPEYKIYYISDDDFNLQGLGEKNSLVKSIRKYYEISVTKNKE